MLKSISLLFGASLILTTSSLLVADKKTWAIQLADGTVYFAQVPQLVETTATFKGAYAWNSTYTFVIKVPEKAGEPLQRVTIVQNERIEAIRYNLDETRALEQGPDGENRVLPLKQVTLDPETQTLAIVFDPPVQPGRTVTLELRPQQNPEGGVYLFGVTAFPVGEKAHGQFLGYGRIHIYDRGYSSFGFP